MIAKTLSAIVGATLRLFGMASCGSTEPTLADGEFRASMKGSFERALSESAGFSIGQLLGRRTGLEMTDRFPSPTADGEQWGVFFALPADATPAPNELFTMTSSDTRVSVFEIRRTNGTNLGNEWTVTSGELRFESVSKSMLAGTFTLAARRTYGTESVTITGSFRALCPPTGSLPGTVCE